MAACLLLLVSVLHQYPFIGCISIFAGLSISVHWYIAYLLVLWWYNQAAYMQQPYSHHVFVVLCTGVTTITLQLHVQHMCEHLARCGLQRAVQLALTLCILASSALHHRSIRYYGAFEPSNERYSPMPAITRVPCTPGC